jgi:hypothetical protein
MTTTELPGSSWSGIDPAQWLRSWQSLWRLAPESLIQPILPGWTFNINGNNSSSPQTEADVVAVHSYGRQLGRIADALAALIEEQHGKAPRSKPYAQFLDMKRQIDAVKHKAAAARISRLVSDLALLKDRDEAEYARLRAELLGALGPDAAPARKRGTV